MDFSPLARHYRCLEAVLAGGALQRMREHGLDRLPARPRVLIVGDGHGRGVETIVRAAPDATIEVVEKSAAMVAVARRRLLRRGVQPEHVVWWCADVREWEAPPDAFDVVVTHFVLDCFTPGDVDAVVARLGRWARSDAVWLLADFRLPSGGWRRLRARVIHRLMYVFFRWTVGLEAKELTSPDAALVRCGFGLRARKLACAGLLHADLWSRQAPPILFNPLLTTRADSPLGYAWTLQAAGRARGAPPHGDGAAV